MKSLKRAIAVLIASGALAQLMAAAPVTTSAGLKLFLQLTGTQKAKMAWNKGPNQASWSDANVVRTIVKMDADNAVISELTPNSIFSSITPSVNANHRCVNPFITDDGTRVIFQDYQENWDATYSGYVINWDGTGLKRFFGGPGVERFVIEGYWRDPVTNKDYAIIMKTNIGVCKVNVDKPSDESVLWNKTSDFMSIWVTLSRDGKRMCLNPHPITNLIQNPGTGASVLKQISNESCYPSISPDNNYNVILQNGTHSLHNIYNPDGSVKVSINTSALILAENGNSNCGETTHNEYECTRYSNHSNFYTFFGYFTAQNPYIMRISDMTFITLEANTASPCNWPSSLSLCIYTPVPTSVKNLVSVRAQESQAKQASYAIDGRKLLQTSKLSNGLVIRTAQNGKASLSCDLIAR